MNRIKDVAKEGPGLQEDLNVVKRAHKRALTSTVTTKDSYQTESGNRKNIDTGGTAEWCSRLKNTG